MLLMYGGGCEPVNLQGFFHATPSPLSPSRLTLLRAAAGLLIAAWDYLRKILEQSACADVPKPAGYL